jgi:hypothetical protein
MAEQPPVRPGRIRKRQPGRWPPNWVTARPRAASGATPRWVKVFGIVGGILVLLIIVMLFSGHGPGRHTHSGLPDHPAPVSPARSGFTGSAEHRG